MADHLSYSVLSRSLTLPFLHSATIFFRQDGLFNIEVKDGKVEFLEHILELFCCEAHRSFHFYEAFKIRRKDAFKGVVNHRKHLLPAHKIPRPQEGCQAHIP